jgi:hypothetical protein
MDKFMQKSCLVAVAYLLASGSISAQQKQTAKPRGVFQNPDAYLLDSSVMYGPENGLIEGMIVSGSERVIAITTARFCLAGAGKIVSEDGKSQENVFFSGDKKADLLFKVLCDSGLRKRDAYQRAAREEQQRLEIAEQERRDNAALNSIAFCVAFPERCR